MIYDKIVASSSNPKSKAALWLDKDHVLKLPNGNTVKAAPQATINWEQQDSNQPDYIKGKPTVIPATIKQMDHNNKYLFEIDFDYIDYDYAKNYFATTSSADIAGACTVFKKNNIYARNYDFHYSQDADFIVRVPRIGDRYASVGMGYKKGLKASDVYNHLYTEEQIKLIPFITVDGINENGVAVNVNVVPASDNSQAGVAVGEGEEVYNTMIVRYILDHATSASNAVTLLSNIKILPTKPILDMGYEYHWMIADSSKAYIVEIYDGELKIIESNIMTNFFINTLTIDLTQYNLPTPYSHSQLEGAAPSSVGLGLASSGVERYNVVRANLSNVDTINSAVTLMRNLKYSLLYTTLIAEDIPATMEHYWFSDFAHEAHKEGSSEYLDIDSLVSEYMASSEFNTIRAMGTAAFENKNRDLEVKPWQTVHTAVYDLTNKTITIESQEGREDPEGSNKLYTVYLNQPDPNELLQRIIALENAD